MKDYGIDHEVILNLSQLYCNGMKKKWAREVIKFQNEFNAAAQEKYPKQITSGFVVQPAHIKDALKEIERCVNEFNLQLLCLPTHCLLYTSPSPRDQRGSRMPSSA